MGNGSSRCWYNIMEMVFVISMMFFLLRENQKYGKIMLFG